MRLRGAQLPAARAAKGLPGKINYFIGNDPSRWRRGIPTYEEVTYPAVYPGIDLVYYGRQGQLEYDFRVAPKADPQRIALRFEGARKLRVDERGDLVITAAGGAVTFRRPVAYQQIAGGRRAVPTEYQVKGCEVAFALGAYDPARELVIDPVLDYTTFIGGSDAESGGSLARDGAGNLYLAGNTTSADFPSAANTRPGSVDGVVSKLTADGALLWSSYVGGSGFDSVVHVAAHGAGLVRVCGVTDSLDLPLAVNSNAGGYDGFVAALDGAGGITWSHYLGGSNYEETYRPELDPNGNTFVVGFTASDDFPGAAAAPAGGIAAFVVKLGPAGARLWTTLVDGGAQEVFYGLTLSPTGAIFAGGATASTDFPGAGGTAYQARQDGLVACLGPDGALRHTTYVGGHGNDRVWGLSAAPGGGAYCAGNTTSSDLAGTINGPIGDNDGFVTKVDAAGSIAWSTYVGGPQYDSVRSVTTDGDGNALLACYSDHPGFQGASNPHSGCAEDAVVAAVDPHGQQILAYHVGGAGRDFGEGVAVDDQHRVYLAGQTNSAESGLRGTYDLFLARVDLRPLVVDSSRDAGFGSLRYAIQYANRQPGSNSVHFRLPGAGPYTITPASPLPVISDPLFIDGNTQPGAAVNTAEVGTNAAPMIVLNGALAGGTGLKVNANSVLAGLVLQRWRTALELNAATDVSGCFIGTTAEGLTEAGNVEGIVVRGGDNQLIGQPAPSSRNVICGNGTAIRCAAGARDVGIYNNLIGLGADGARPLGNGVGVIFQSDGHWLGGPRLNEANVIAHNTQAAVYVAPGATGNRLQGNAIFDNGEGIVLSGDGNEAIPAPLLRLVTLGAGQH
ncbi:MAG: SBBP repeat-containing protein [Armatimonadetes bacterium]|nr:SBBP repeat-containing protein [Armatimonadota bacterium]